MNKNGGLGTREGKKERKEGSVWKSALGEGLTYLELRTSGEKEKKGGGGEDGLGGT